MLKLLGAFEEWVAFGVWGLFVAAAAALVFKSSILAAYRRIAIALDWQYSVSAVVDELRAL